MLFQLRQLEFYKHGTIHIRLLQAHALQKLFRQRRNIDHPTNFVLLALALNILGFHLRGES